MRKKRVSTGLWLLPLRARELLGLWLLSNVVQLFSKSSAITSIIMCMTLVEILSLLCFGGQVKHWHWSMPFFLKMWVKIFLSPVEVKAVTSSCVPCLPRSFQHRHLGSAQSFIAPSCWQSVTKDARSSVHSSARRSPAAELGVSRGASACWHQCSTAKDSQQQVSNNVYLGLGQ